MSDAKGSGSQRLEKVRRNMLRMTSPVGFGDDSEAKGFGSLSAINVPPWLGRADAAYDRAVRLFRVPDSPGVWRYLLVFCFLVLVLSDSRVFFIEEFFSVRIDTVGNSFGLVRE